MWLIYIVKSIFAKNLYLVKKMTFSEIKILEMAVNDRSERRPIRPMEEDEEEVMIPILKVVLITGHFRHNEDI